MPSNYGQQTRLRIGRQATHGTAPAADAYRQRRFYSSTLEGKAGNDADPVLGGTLQNDFDTPELGRAMQEVSGDVTYPLCGNQSGDVFADLFGPPATTGASAPFTHTFKSGVASAPLRAAAEMFLASNRQRRFLGLVPSTLKLSVEKTASGDNTQRMTVGYIGSSETTQSSALSGTTAERAFLPINARLARVLLDGVDCADALAASFDFTTGVAAVPYLDGADTMGPIERDSDSTLTGTLRVRTNSNLYHAISDLGAIKVLTIAFGTFGVSTSGVSFAMQVRFGKAGQPIQGRGALTSEFPFMGQATESEPMLTVALFNAIAASQYV